MSENQAKSEPKTISKSELEFGEKVDRCLADGLVKFGTGLGLGMVFSAVLFRR
jgi:inner membrane organizing system protein 1